MGAVELLRTRPLQLLWARLAAVLHQRRDLIMAAGLVALYAAWQMIGAEASFPGAWNLHLRRPIDLFEGWIIGNQTHHWLWLYLLDPVTNMLDRMLRGLEAFLLWLPWPVVILAIMLVAHRVGRWRAALATGLALVLLGALGVWQQSMQTLTLIVVSVAIALLIGIPLGILAARSDRFDRALRPVLDAMQTLPAFVYLIPVLLFFGIARVPAAIATVIFAVPPVIRLTSLGIRQVPAAAIETGQSFGSTSKQLLVKVQLPLALPTLMAGVNQTIMMALGMVVIAAIIGAGGLGREVLVGLQRLRVGQAFEAGLAIVILAMVLDRLSSTLVHASRSENWRWEAPALRRWRALRGPYRTWIYLFLALILVAVAVLWRQYAAGAIPYPAAMRLPLAQPVDSTVAWMRDNLYMIAGTGLGTKSLSDWLTINAISPLRNLLQTWLPWPVIVAGMVMLAWRASGRRLALWTAVGMLTLGLLGMWPQSMDTLSQILVAVFLALAVALPIGIAAGKSDRFAAVLRPLLDFFQTIPPFVYLVPVIMLFSIGRVPGIIASVLYALPPAIRLTSLGIRQVDPEIVEAARAFGSTSRQVLLKVELPLAMPSIMMGVNQTVIMVLSMVIIAGLVGGAGLGLEAVTGLAKNEPGRGIEAGLSIVIIAMILDRITQGWAERWRVTGPE